MQKYLMPVGNTDFKEIRESGLYYIDKTMLIDQLVNRMRAKVTLFTRPRRFGKTLNMSMLEQFFDIRKDSKSIFDGLKITENRKLCIEWMNQYPTIFISLKDVDGENFEAAIAQFSNIISKVYDTHKYLIKEENNLEDYEVDKFKAFLTEKASKTNLNDALFFLSKLLFEYYQKPVIILIDEYDVPMAKGDLNGYYKEITSVMRLFLSKALKDNRYLKLAVMTGCLKVAEESIFTGLNNLSVNTIADTDYEESFGFTNKEMEKLLVDTKLLQYQSVIKEWYDGYIFGRMEVYCPWDVLKYVDALQRDPNTLPVNYWANTSGNDIIKSFLNSDYDVSEEFEILLNGGYIEKKINPNITYGNLTSDVMNLWSILYMTGYLTTILQKNLPVFELPSTQVKGKYELPFKLKLPNKEIRMLFEETVAIWFKETISKDERTDLFDAIWNEDANRLTEIISNYLYDTISYFDYNENYYHAFLTGLLSGRKNVVVKSNVEVGKGRADIILKDKSKRFVAIFELKRAKSEDEMEKSCKEALKQIEENKYDKPFKREKVIKYGVAFFGKDCLVKKVI